MINSVNLEGGSAPKCPYCGKIMEGGYLQSAQQIYFNKGRKARIFASGDLKTRNVSSLGMFKAPYIRGYVCEDCGKIILDYRKR